MDRDRLSSQQHSQHLLKGTPFLHQVKAQQSGTYLTLIRQETEILLQDPEKSPGIQGQEGQLKPLGIWKVARTQEPRVFGAGRASHVLKPGSSVSSRMRRGRPFGVREFQPTHQSQGSCQHSCRCPNSWEVPRPPLASPHPQGCSFQGEPIIQACHPCLLQVGEDAGCGGGGTPRRSSGPAGELGSLNSRLDGQQLFSDTNQKQRRWGRPWESVPRVATWLFGHKCALAERGMRVQGLGGWELGAFRTCLCL